MSEKWHLSKKKKKKENKIKASSRHNGWWVDWVGYAEKMISNKSGTPTGKFKDVDSQWKDIGK